MKYDKFKELVDSMEKADQITFLEHVEEYMHEKKHESKIRYVITQFTICGCDKEASYKHAPSIVHFDLIDALSVMFGRFGKEKALEMVNELAYGLGE